MSWVAIVFVPAIAATCGWIIFHYHDFPTATVTVATTALLVDTLGLFGSLWKIVLGSGPKALEPITQQASRRRVTAADKQKLSKVSYIELTG